jgi:hypothetical protein
MSNKYFMLLSEKSEGLKDCKVVELNGSSNDIITYFTVGTKFDKVHALSKMLSCFNQIKKIDCNDIIFKKVIFDYTTQRIFLRFEIVGIHDKFAICLSKTKDDTEIDAISSDSIHKIDIKFALD